MPRSYHGGGGRSDPKAGQPAVQSTRAVWDSDAVISVLVALWTLIVTIGVGLYLYSEQLRKSKLDSLPTAEELVVRVESRLAAQEVQRKKKYHEKALLRLWQSEPWKREFVGEWSMIEGSRQGFYEWIMFMGKSESVARKVAALPTGNSIFCRRLDDKTLDEACMRIDTTGINANVGPWVQVGGVASEVVADQAVNFERIFWDEEKRALVRTRESADAGYSWKQTRTISRGVMHFTAVTTKNNGTSMTFSMALQKKKTE